MSFTLTFTLHLVFGQGFNIWGMAVKPPTERDFFKKILNSKTSVTLEEAIFRSELAFKPANLKEHYQFWEEEILKDHPPEKYSSTMAYRGKNRGIFEILYYCRVSRNTVEFLLSSCTSIFQLCPSRV